MKLPIMICIVSSVVLSAPGWAAEKAHREAGAHSHGHGRVNIAVEGSELELELEAPGADIVGFEHPAKSKKDKTAIAAAKRSLKDAGNVIELPSDAGCQLSGSTVSLHGHAKHNEFHVTYRFTCAKVTALRQITFKYFKTFSRTIKLDVAVISAKEQKQFEATREQPSIQLGGLL